jgi:hypothetical protein
VDTSLRIDGLLHRSRTADEELGSASGTAIATPAKSPPSATITSACDSVAAQRAPRPAYDEYPSSIPVHAVAPRRLPPPPSSSSPSTADVQRITDCRSRSGHGRRRFTPQEVTLILSSDEVAAMIRRRSVDSDRLRTLLASTPSLRLLQDVHGVRAIRDRIRTVYRSANSAAAAATTTTSVSSSADLSFSSQ